MLLKTKMMNKIAVIGGSYLQLPVVKKAKEMGLEVFCFSWEEDAVCKDYVDCFYPISIIEKENILEVCKGLDLDAIVSIASDTAVVTVNYVAENLGLISNPDAYSSTTTNKFLMRECFLEAGVSSPRYYRMNSLDLKNGKFPEFNYPLIVKPTDRSGSRGVQKVNKLDDLKPAIESACKEAFSGEAIIEEFIDGLEVSVETISWKGTHHLLQITDKVTTGAPFFVELEHHQPSALSETIKQKIKDIVLHALDALHIKYGASHSELKITPTGDVYVIEIGARMGGDFIGSDLVQLSTGYDFVQEVINVALGKWNEPVLKDGLHSGVFFLSAQTPKVANVIEKAESLSSVISYELLSKQLNNLQCSADRSGYFIYQSDKRMLLEDFL